MDGAFDNSLSNSQGTVSVILFVICFRSVFAKVCKFVKIIDNKGFYHPKSVIDLHSRNTYFIDFEK